jgi:two-component system LytT family response regulator
MIRALIVDDEPLAREGVRLFLAAHPDVKVVGEAASGSAAVALIHAEAPDLVFLDVRMAGMDGFEVVEAVGAARMPSVVFVTAYDAFALRAFDAHAVDYLLKPMDPERFARALERVRTRMAAARPDTPDPRIEALLAEVRAIAAPRRYLTRFAVRSRIKTVFVRACEVEWIEAEGNYARLHVGKASHLVRETMAKLEERLDPAEFVRIHRSTIVRVDQIREMAMLFRGEYQVTLRDGTRLVANSAAREKLRELLG